MTKSSVRLVVSTFVLALFLCVSGLPLHAQTVGGTILGTIQDQQGGVIGKVDISARSLDTGAVRKVTSSDSGEYRITSVPAGSYEVTAVATGFKSEVRS